MWCLCKAENTDQVNRTESSEADSRNENYIYERDTIAHYWGTMCCATNEDKKFIMPMLKTGSLDSIMHKTKHQMD